ncbi:5-methylcytosine-specific restriction protein B [Psychrobacter sp. PL19]|uniref:AAA family ATPase n=1 Tax=Psychrobacter sp. PL19 TaxID=2760711 RepID=UPI002FF1CB96
MVTKHSSEKYTWMPAFEAIANWIVDYENNQERLLDILRRNGISISRKSTNEIGFQAVSMMDPFTFFLLITRSQSIHNLLVDLFHIMRSDAITPADYDGIPLFKDCKKYVFPEDPKLHTSEIGDVLWKLFHQARASNIQAETFKQALAIPDTGFVLITLCLYLVCPSSYLPIDSHVRRWLVHHEVEIPSFNWKDYKRTLDRVKEISNKPFCQIYDEASTENLVNGINIMMSSNHSEETMIVAPSLSRILYGPPGTGKTYHTTELAVQCVASDWYYELNNEYLDEPERRELIKAKYDELTAKGRIAFTTFHQSFSYEDFVEGIRPVVVEGNDNNSNISYEVVDGIFKQLCTNAITTEQTGSTQTVNIEGKNIWKLSLGNTNISDENEIFNECIDNNYVLLGWGDDIDFSNCSNRREVVAKIEQSHNISLADDPNNYKATAVNIFKNAVSIGDLVIISDGNHKFRAIAEITDDYEFLDTKERYGFQQLRKVKWLRIYSPSLPKERLFDKSLSQMAIYQLRDTTIDREKLKQLLTPEPTTNSRELPYLIIIDEINRGNISRIFGELITLLEPDKRKGGTDAREVILPYSKLPFSVPSNLYVLGTMNTADKSLAQLDLALRRRFDFIELLPKPELLEGVEVYDIEIADLLKVINQRIEVLLDREHTIGHSYFWSLKDLNTDDEKEIELGNIFKRRIIPLLQEYFFSDWERIGWVLNDPSKHNSEQFIQTGNISPAISELFDSSINGLNDRRYHINETAFNNPESYKKILTQPKSKSSDSEA